jgi:phage regulator Rha-like protein
MKVSKLILNPEYGLYERQGKPFCSSRQVAETFGKEHHEKNITMFFKA